MGGFFYESLTINSAGTFFIDRKSGDGRCAEVTVIRGSTVLSKSSKDTNEASSCMHPEAMFTIYIQLSLGRN